jgi:hypothetical protein
MTRHTPRRTQGAQRVWLSVCSAVCLSGLGQRPITWTVAPDSATVGDTIYVSRTLPAPAGATARAQPLARTATVEPLADPVVERDGGLLTLRYAVAVFAPGPQAIPMPPVELFYADGTSETILGDTAHLRLRSVLPAGDSLPPPRPSLGPLARPIRRLEPAALLVTAAIALSALWAVARRRVGPRPEEVSAGGAAAVAPVGTWVEAGELRAVATRVSMGLRRELAARAPLAGAALSTDACLAVLQRERPAWPLDEIADVLHALDRARFAPAVPQDVMALAEQARMISERLALEA